VSEADAVADVSGEDWSAFEHPRLSAIDERSASFTYGRRVAVSINDCMLAYFILLVLSWMRMSFGRAGAAGMMHA
jgi:hypothetical protein